MHVCALIATAGIITFDDAGYVTLDLPGRAEVTVVCHPGACVGDGYRVSFWPTMDEAEAVFVERHGVRRVFNLDLPCATR